MEMEYIQGENLQDYAKHYYEKNNQNLSEEEVIKYIQQIGNALSYIHQQRILHRDVKPSNIMLRKNSKQAILIDFGIAREFVQNETATHTNVITQGYAPIEQYQRHSKRGAYTDVYALAATLYYSLTLVNLIPANYRYEHKIPLSPPNQYNPKISDYINSAILKGMEVLPENRPQTIHKWLRLMNIPRSRIYTSPQSISMPQSTSKSIPLESDVEVNYTKLRDLLSNQKWKEADNETYQVMLKAAKREKEGWFRIEDIDNFPCQDLRTIDQLWVHYSSSRFGFSIQKKIYQQLGGTKKFNKEIWEKFGDVVGWRMDNKWIYYDNLNNFSWNAPLGHLPASWARCRFYLLLRGDL